MAMLVLDRYDERRIRRHRRRCDASRFDEVWNGVYVVGPLRDNQHQEMVGDIACVIDQAFDRLEVDVYPGVNVSDRREGWRKNVRIPDVAVYLPDNTAEDCGTHYFGGPDFAVEILTPGDWTRKKFPFYARVGVRELLLVDRHPWRLELHRRAAEGWTLVGTSTPETSDLLTSDVLPLTFRLLPGEPRPAIEVARPDVNRTWTI